MFFFLVDQILQSFYENKYAFIYVRPARKLYVRGRYILPNQHLFSSSTDFSLKPLKHYKIRFISLCKYSYI